MLLFKGGYYSNFLRVPKTKQKVLIFTSKMVYLRLQFKGGFYFNSKGELKTAVTIQGRLLFEGGF